MLDKQTIITLLENVERPGMDNLIKWLDESGYFISPASTRFHGCYEGGLAEHSFLVMAEVNKFRVELKPELSQSPGQKQLPVTYKNS